MLYTITSTDPIVKEMTRYEHSTVVSKCDPKCPEWCKGDTELESTYTTYRFVIDSPIGKSPRWASFQSFKRGA